MSVRGIALAFALLVTVTSGPACTVSRDETIYPLSTGRWDFVYRDVIANTCFPLGVPVPPGYASSANVVFDDPALHVGWGWLPLPPAPLPGAMSGVFSNGEFTVAGAHPLVLSTACALVVNDIAQGVVFASGEADLTITVKFDGHAVTASGANSQCQSLAGQTFDGIPFPTLSNPVDGTCAVTLRGTATLATF